MLSGMSISSLFICIVCCLLVMRRMSNYMIERSSNLVDRLAVSTGLAHQISGTAQQQSGEEGVPNFEEVLSKEKRRFHAKMGAAIGSGPREARQRHSNDVAWKTFPSGLIGRLRPERGGSAYGYVPPRPPPSLGERLPPAARGEPSRGICSRLHPRRPTPSPRTAIRPSQRLHLPAVRPELLLTCRRHLPV